MELCETYYKQSRSKVPLLELRGKRMGWWDKEEPLYKGGGLKGEGKKREAVGLMFLFLKDLEGKLHTYCCCSKL